MVKGNSFWKERKVLVTGATGLVGAWLVKDLCARGATVVGLIQDQNPQSELYRSGDIQRIIVVNGELENFRDCERVINQNEIDTVFHLGAQTIVGTAQRDPFSTWESNIRGTYNLLEACRLHKNLVKRILVASSDKAYGTKHKLPYTEDMPLEGKFPYEVSKTCTDLLAQAYVHSYGLPVTIVRCGNIFGGGDLNWSRIVPGTIRSFLNKEAPIIRSDGKFVRDYVYVKDISRAYIELAENLVEKNLAGEAFNVSGEAPLRVLDVVAAVQDVMDCKNIKPKILNSASGEIHSQYLSSGKIQKLLKWKPQLKLKDALAETVRWYRDYLSK